MHSSSSAAAAAASSTTNKQRVHFDPDGQTTTKRQKQAHPPPPFPAAAAAALPITGSSSSERSHTITTIKKQVECARCHKVTRLCARQTTGDRNVCCLECLLRMFGCAQQGHYRVVGTPQVIEVKLGDTWIDLHQAFVALEQPSDALLLDALHLLDSKQVPSAQQDATRGLACRACKVRLPPAQATLAGVVAHLTNECAGLTCACTECALHLPLKHMTHHMLLHKARASIDSLLKDASTISQDERNDDFQDLLVGLQTCAGCDRAIKTIASTSSSLPSSLVILQGKMYHSACIAPVYRIDVRAPILADEPCGRCNKCLSTDALVVTHIGSHRFTHYHPQCFAALAPKQSVRELGGWGRLPIAEAVRVRAFWEPSVAVAASSMSLPPPSISCASLEAPMIPTSPHVSLSPTSKERERNHIPTHPPSPSPSTPPCSQPRRPEETDPEWPRSIASQHRQVAEQFEVDDDENEKEAALAPAAATPATNKAAKAKGTFGTDDLFDDLE